MNDLPGRLGLEKEGEGTDRETKDETLHACFSHRERNTSTRWFLIVAIGGKSPGATA